MTTILSSITDWGVSIAFLIFETTWKSTVILGFALLLVRVLKSLPASLRQVVLSVAVVLMLFSTVFIPLFPHWTVPAPRWLTLQALDKPAISQPEHSASRDTVITEKDNSSRQPVRDSEELSVSASGFKEETRDVSLINFLLSLIAFIWLAGVLILSGRVCRNLAGLKRLRAASSVLQSDELNFTVQEAKEKSGIDARRKITVLQNETITVPLTWGVFRHVILLPKHFEELPGESRRAVLIHELAHIRRGDFLVRIFAEAMCVILWFQPLVWLTRRRLREEQERAADDHVLEAGEKPSGYAKMLLELFDRLPSDGRSAMAAGMAEPGSLKTRLEAILSPNLKRRPLSASEVLIIALLGFGLTIPLTTFGFSKESSFDAVLIEPNALNENSFRVLEDAASPDSRSIKQKADENEVVKKTINNKNSTDDLKPVNTDPDGQIMQDEADNLPAVAPTAMTTVTQTNLGDNSPAVAPTVTPIITRTNSPENQNAPQDSEVAPNFLRNGMAEAGYPDLSEAELSALRKANVSHFYVRELAAAGYTNLPLKALIRLRENGVGAQYIKEMRAFGYENLSPEMLSDFRWCGVSPSYIREMAALGYANLPAKTMVAFRRNSVNGAYINEMRLLVKGNISADEISDMRWIGVTKQFIDDLGRAGLGRLTANQLINMRQHGITIDFIEKIRARDNKNYSANDLISMRANGER